LNRWFSVYTWKSRWASPFFLQQIRYYTSTNHFTSTYI